MNVPGINKARVESSSQIDGLSLHAAGTTYVKFSGAVNLLRRAIYSKAAVTR